jgi:molecular chaperone GrpE
MPKQDEGKTVKNEGNKNLHTKKHPSKTATKNSPPPQQNAEAIELKNQLMRLAAELDNSKKRHEIEKQELKKYATSSIIKELIPVIENFHLIMDNSPKEEIAKNDTFNNFFKGIEITHNELNKIFESSGIKRLYPLGEKFDHHFHQAIKQEESDQESGTILKVLQAGYIMNDRLLKEALVVISK